MHPKVFSPPNSAQFPSMNVFRTRHEFSCTCVHTLIPSLSLVSTNTGCSIHDERVQDVAGGGDRSCEKEEKLYQPKRRVHAPTEGL